MTKKEQAERTRRRLLDAAIRLFARRGYALTSMSDLAREIDMTPGALYWHFDGKEALLIAALEELQRRLVTTLAEPMPAASARQDHDGSVAADARELIARVARVGAEHSDYMRFVGVVGIEASASSPRVERALREAYRGVAAIAASLVRRGIEEGLLEPDVDVECAAQLFLGLFMGGILHQHLFRDELPAARAFPVLERLALGALLPGSRAPTGQRRRR